MTPSGSFPFGERLLGRLQGFLDRLRAEGMTVGTAAGVDLSGALDVVPVLDRTAFREACRVTLAKSRRDLAVVDRVFEEYWSSGVRVPVPPTSEVGKLPRPKRARGSPQPLPPRARSPPREETVEMLEGRYSPSAPALSPPVLPVPSTELRRLRAGARRFRRQVATLPGRRWQPGPRGSIDLRRTAHEGIRTGGEWVELVRRHRSPRRADLVVLWDVSGSMREHTASLFALVHVLQRAIRRTRVYAFGHEIEEVTGLFQAQSYARALPELAGRLAGTGGGTQIAHCLAEFRRHWGAVVRPSTTVLIISDGWDLGETAPLEQELDRLRSAAAQVAWVNPYAAEKGFEPVTAALKTALPYLALFTSPADFPRSHRPRGAGAGGSIAS